MYLNDLTRDLVQAHRDDLLLVAESHRRSQLAGGHDDGSIVIIRRAVGSGLVRLGKAVTGEPTERPVVLIAADPT